MSALCDVPASQIMKLDIILCPTAYSRVVNFTPWMIKYFRYHAIVSENMFEVTSDSQVNDINSM